jgi:polyisoprenoid-binding protein YceI
MNRLFFRSAALSALLLAAALPAAGRAAKAKALPQPQALSATAGSSLKVLGDSTLHKWELKATQLQISAQLEPGSGGVWVGVQAGKLKGLALQLPVAGLKSDEGEKMDKNMRAALEAEKFPEIRFAMAGYEIKDGEVLAKGSLTIHGVSKDAELKGKVSGDAGSVAVTGSVEIVMSAYGVKPPVMMLGTVRVADKLSIAYDFVLK